VAAWPRHTLRWAEKGFVSLSSGLRALVQRVSEARVEVEGATSGEIGTGLCVFLGVKHDDTTADVEKLVVKVTRLRIFPDQEGQMNLSLLDVGGDLLIVSQFTLYGDTRRGNRPSYSEAAEPAKAKQLYEAFVDAAKKLCQHVATGVFQAHMEVSLTNSGPVTVMCYSNE
jgi:D-tyrosyl-tRNA(Tyr) deacylase